MLGSSGGCGVTHIAFLLAQYASRVRASHCCYVEMNESLQMKSLRYPVDEPLEELPQQSSFLYQGIRVLEHVDLRETLPTLEKSYDQIFLDAGYVQQIPDLSILRPDQIFVVCSNAPWKEREVSEWINRNKGRIGMESITYLINDGDQKQVSHYRRRYEVPFYGVPYNKAISQLQLDTIKAIQKFFDCRGR